MTHHAELVELGRKWLLRPQRWGGHSSHSCSVVITELVSCARETPDVLGFCQDVSVLLECKASCSDFRAERMKPARRVESVDPGVGNYRYYFAPKGIIPKSELPPGWGLIEVSEKESHIEVQATAREANKGDEVAILISLVRRLGVSKDRGMNVRLYKVDSGLPAKATATVVADDKEARKE